MWIYADSVEPRGYIPKLGDVVISSRREFGVEDRVVGLVIGTDGFPSIDHIVNIIVLPIEADDLA
jgi:hypothetical protein